MKTAILTDEHRELFAEMDPFFFLERGGLPNRVCIGAVMEGGEGAFDDPAGLMVLCIEREAVTVEWICVRGKYRMQKVGSVLMAIAFRAAHDSGHERLNMYVNREFGRKDVCLYESAFLSDYGFKKDKELPGEWAAELGELDGSYIDGVGEGKKLSLPLGGLRGDTREEFYRELEGLDGKAFLYDPVTAADMADQELSRVYYNEGKLKSLVFIEKLGENLYITGFWGESNLSLAMAFAPAIENAVKKYGNNRQIRLIKNSSKNRETALCFFPDPPAKSSGYYASVTDYYSEMKDLEVDPEEVVMISGGVLEEADMQDHG
ncbi:MAG: hypothetical protein IKI75_10025 [Lachnospiraceae bacterium]|nr:hypothetical protein [Lachnospiraceae bacterium]